ncbi:N6-adenosine-methyltransferase MT-A70-like [Argentina anserina]|uniref:N6-adenosine-methyltransferase MT-A70-like n=1 Tax=Argentina anserina TaxID=57926 RepID=UPI0021764402|nr:N6-adenosine-methyltransferase MT-A70-like [Potentilla anserina]
METQSGGKEETAISAVKTMREDLETRMETQRATQLQLLSFLQSELSPAIVPTIDLSLKVLSSFNHRPFSPTPPLPDPKPNPRRKKPIPPPPILPPPQPEPASPELPKPDPTPDFDESASPLAVIRAMIAVRFLERVPFMLVESSELLKQLETDAKASPEEKAALREAGGEAGGILAVEMALRSMAEENGGVILEEYAVNGKSRVTVRDIDRTRLMKELPESKQDSILDGNGSFSQMVSGGSNVGRGGGPWVVGPEPYMGGLPPLFPGMGPRGGVMGMPRGMMGSPMHRPNNNMGQSNGAMVVSPNGMPPPNKNMKSEDDEMKDLEALLSKKTYKELQKSKTGEELLDLIHRPTAKETAVANKFKSKGGSQVKEYCTSLTKEDCRRQSNSLLACEKVHFRRIIALHTDVNLGDCSFLDTCRHMKTCKYVHYELDSTPDVSNMMAPPKPLKQRAEYCSEVELGQPQWINCDIRNFRMDILGQFGVIMADPPWDIHMELPYGTMADDEMRTLNVPALQTDGLIFLWVTGRAMELGRECLELWGYKRIEEMIWVKTNQLQRIIRTGRTGHWLNHSKEHCLVGIKGDPLVNRNIDTDVIVAEVRETSRKPDEMYPLLERISPRTRKLELFARMHNTHAGWMSLGNQLSGVRLVDEGLRARFKAAYPEVEVQPASPPRASAMEVDLNAAQTRSPFSEAKPTAAQLAEAAASQQAEPAGPDVPASDVKPVVTTDVDMAG